MKFEWDARKAETNLYKHGISFDLATAALRDPFLIERVDDSDSYGEDRITVTAMAFGLILIIVYTLREDRIRIISARKAKRNEQDNYYIENGY